MQQTIVTSLALQDFRNFETKVIEFGEDQTLIVGNNGQGKTNVLEALSLLSTGRSFRAKTLSDCVRVGAQVAHCSVMARIEDEDTKISLAIVSNQSEYSKRASTRFQRNGTAKTRAAVIGILKTVLFRPEDMELITDGPSYKRDFLDDVLIQVSAPYIKSLREYEKALKHRNKLILQLRDGFVTRKDFIFWDTLLIKHGDIITRMRKKFILFIAEFVEFPIKGEITYDESVMSEERLHTYAREEVAAGKTLVGPHRDNFFVKMQIAPNRLDDVARFGSRGQQRMSVLWLKVAALQFIERETKITPILLLDDLFSELDETNREIIFELFQDRQVIMTSAEEIAVLPPESTKGKVLEF